MPLLREVLHSDDLYCVRWNGVGFMRRGSVSTRGGLSLHRRSATWSLRKPAFSSAIPGRMLFSTMRNWRLTSIKGSCRVTQRDPILEGSKCTRLAFLQQLHRVGLLTWRKKAKCRVGCSFFEIKDSILRLVVDARKSNGLCRPPPFSRLAVPLALDRLCSGEGAEETDLIEMARAGQTRATNHNNSEVRQRGLFGCSKDHTDGFYQFKCEALASLFGPGFQATVTMFAAVYDDKKAGQVSIPKGEILECCFLAMPLGGPGHPCFATMPSRRP